MSDRPARAFQRPTFFERLLNRGIGALVGLGIGLPDMRVLQVRGRKSGKLYSLPVDLLSEGGRLYLVAPRGYAEWVRNAEVAGAVTLRRGGRAERYRLRALPDAEKPPILKAYRRPLPSRGPAVLPRPGRLAARGVRHARAPVSGVRADARTLTRPPSGDQTRRELSSG